MEVAVNLNDMFNMFLWYLLFIFLLRHSKCYIQTNYPPSVKFIHVCFEDKYIYSILEEVFNRNYDNHLVGGGI